MDTAVVDSAAEGASSALVGLAHAAVLNAPTAPMASAIGAAPRARMRIKGVNFQSSFRVEMEMWCTLIIRGGPEDPSPVGVIVRSWNGRRRRTWMPAGGLAR